MPESGYGDAKGEVQTAQASPRTENKNNRLLFSDGSGLDVGCPKAPLEKPIYSTQQQHLRSQDTGCSKRAETEASLPNPSQGREGRQGRNKMT